jgi:hypothetical protein
MRLKYTSSCAAFTAVVDDLYQGMMQVRVGVGMVCVWGGGEEGREGGGGGIGDHQGMMQVQVMQVKAMQEGWVVGSG